MERDKARREKENTGCFWLGGIILVGLLVANEERSFWPLIISVFIGFWVNNIITKDDDICTTNTRSITYKEAYSTRKRLENTSNTKLNSTSNTSNNQSTGLDGIYVISILIFVFAALFFIYKGVTTTPKPF